MASGSAVYNLTYKIGAQTTGEFYANVNKASKSLTGMGTTARRIAGVITGALAGISIKNLADDFVDTYQTFETSMKNTSAIARASKSDYDRMEDAARKAGRATTKTAAESADALGYMSLAGWNVNDSIKGLMPILRLSEATGKDLKTTSDLVTDSLAACGMGVNDLSTYMDKLVELNNDANTNAEQAMYALVRSGGAARNLTMDFDDLATSLGVLANNGRKGNKAGTTMNAILTRIASNKNAVEEIDALGLSLYDNKGNFIGFEQFLENVNTRLKKLDLKQQNKALYKLAGTQYMSQFRYLLDSVEKKAGQTQSTYAQLKANIQDSTGALNEMNKTSTSTLEASRLRLQSAYQDLQIGTVDVFSDTAREAIDKIALEIPKITDSLTQFGNEHAYDLVSMIDTAANGVERIASGVMQAGNFLIDHRGVIEGVAAGVVGFRGVRGIASTIGSVADVLPLFTRGGRQKYLSSSGSGVAREVAGAATNAAGNTLTSGNGSQTVSRIFGISENAEGLASGVLSLMSPAGIAAAIGAVGFGAYQQFKVWDRKMSDLNLDKHFGDVTLSLNELYDAADEIIGRDVSRKIDALDDLATTIDQDKDSIDKLKESIGTGDWKIDAGIKLDKEESKSYAADVKSLAEQTIKLVQDEWSQANTSLSLLGINGKDGLSKEINGFYSEQSSRLESLSARLKKVVSNALKDGKITIDERSSIKNIQNSISRIQQVIADAKFKVKLDMAGRDNDSANAGRKGISSKSFKALVKQVDKAQDDANKKYDEAYQNAATVIEAEYETGKKDEKARKKRNDAYKELNKKTDKARANVTAQSTLKITDQITSRYSRQGDINSYVRGALKNVNLNEIRNSNDPQQWAQDFLTELQSNAASAKNYHSRGAVSEFLPQLENYRKRLISERKMLQQENAKIPQALTDALTSVDALKTYASGADATWSEVAEALAGSGKGQEVISILQEKGVQIPQELVKAMTSQPGLINSGASTLRGQVSSAVNGQFSTPFQIGAPVDIYLKPNVMNSLKDFNPTADMLGISTPSLTVSGNTSNSGGRKKKHKKNAIGGIYANPIMTSFAEKGPEAAIPLNNTSRARQLWMAAGAGVGAGRTSALNKLVNRNGSRNNGGKSSGNTTNNWTFSPNVSVNGNTSASEVQKGIEMSYPQFRKMMKEYDRETKRRSFNGK